MSRGNTSQPNGPQLRKASAQQLTEKGWDNTMSKEDNNEVSSMIIHSTLKKHGTMEMGTAEDGLLLNTEIQASDVR